MFKRLTLTNTQLNILYVSSFYLYGVIISALGPIIPFLTAHTNIPETGYSSFFSCRAVGMLVGAFLLRYTLHKYPNINLHQVISASLLAIGLSSLLFSNYFNLPIQNIAMFISSIACCNVEINLVVCLLKSCEPERYSFWLITQTFSFGVGALTAPIVVYLFQLHTYNLLGVASLKLGLAYYFIQEIKKESIEQSDHRGPSSIKQKKFISKQTQYMFAFLMFMNIGIVSDYSGWSSSYAVITGIASAQKATEFPFLYWISFTIAKLIYNFITGTSTFKVKIIMALLIFSQTISILSNQLGFNTFSLYFNCVTSGIFMSPVYAILLSLSPEHHLFMNKKQVNLIMTVGFIGEGVVTWLCGVFMEIVSASMFYYFNWACLVMMGVATAVVLNNLKKESSKQEQQLNNRQMLLIAPK